ncbi:MAG: hypothetical protein ABWZ02_01380 [Nakamurella sp.]
MISPTRRLISAGPTWPDTVVGAAVGEAVAGAVTGGPLVRAVHPVSRINAERHATLRPNAMSYSQTNLYPLT